MIIWPQSSALLLKLHYLEIETIILRFYWYIKLDHSWNPYRIINVFVLESSHNPGQNLLRQKLKIQ